MVTLYSVFEHRESTDTKTGQKLKWAVMVKRGSQWECERYIDKHSDFQSKLTTHRTIEQD